MVRSYQLPNKCCCAIHRTPTTSCSAARRTRRGSDEGSLGWRATPLCLLTGNTRSPQNTMVGSPILLYICLYIYIYIHLAQRSDLYIYWPICHPLCYKNMMWFVLLGAFGIDRSYSYSASLGKYYNKGITWHLNALWHLTHAPEIRRWEMTHIRCNH